MLFEPVRGLAEVGWRGGVESVGGGFRCVPEAQAAEELNCTLFFSFAMGSFLNGTTALVLRVLYRLRTLSEQVPFDAATFSFLFFLLGCVTRKGGVGIDTGGEQDGDEALEQVALVLDVIKFHQSECTSRVLVSLDSLAT